MLVSLCLFVGAVKCTIIKYCTACKKHSKLCMRSEVQGQKHAARQYVLAYALTTLLCLQTSTDAQTHCRQNLRIHCVKTGLKTYL